VRNAFFGAVGGCGFDLGDEVEFFSINRHAVGKRAAHVDADADFSHEAGALNA